LKDRRPPPGCAARSRAPPPASGKHGCHDRKRRLTWGVCISNWLFTMNLGQNARVCRQRSGTRDNCQRDGAGQEMTNPKRLCRCRTPQVQVTWSCVRWIRLRGRRRAPRGLSAARLPASGEVHARQRDSPVGDHVVRHQRTDEQAHPEHAMRTRNINEPFLRVCRGHRNAPVDIHEGRGGNGGLGELRSGCRLPNRQVSNGFLRRRHPHWQAPGDDRHPDGPPDFEGQPQRRGHRQG
jgi:hypothetical protein